MDSATWNSDSYSENLAKLVNGVSENAKMGSGSCSSSSLVLDSERGELVRAPASSVRKGLSPEKAMAALRIHSEAERRRRGRINAHLTTLRGLIPGAKKMDKASLLAEVISHLKELKRNAAEASKSFLVPMEIDEVRVEQKEDGSDESPYFIRASLCCNYRTEVLSDLRQALDALHLKTVRAEVATLGSRMKIVFLMTECEEGYVEDIELRQLLANSVQKALRSVLDKFSDSEEFSSTTVLSNKRRRFHPSILGAPVGDSW